MKRIILVALASLALTQEQQQPEGYWEVTFSESEYSTFTKGQPGDPDYQGGAS